MGSSLCFRSSQQTTVVPVIEREAEGFHELKKQTTKTSLQQVNGGLRHSSWLEENDSPLRQTSRDEGDTVLSGSFSSSFRSRTSLRFFRRNSVRPSPSTTVLLQQSLSMTIDGNLLRKYSVHQIIGKGAFSTVIMIEEKTTGKQYALKVIEKKRSFRTNVPWERELNILKKVHHESIVNLIETHATTSKIYFVLELALGGDLHEKLSSVGKFSEAKARNLLSPLLDALRYLHKHGVTHRDLKLDNCLFKTKEEDSPILLSDFGLAYLQTKDNESEGMQTTCGTAEYISPEMLEGEVYTNLIDMWSFGVITFATLSGKMPFQDENKAKLFRKIRNANYSFDSEVWSDISDAARDFVSQLICVSTQRRLSAESALKHSWILY